MNRLTQKSQNSDMIWFVDSESNMILEPCEMRNSHIRILLKKLSEYEDLEENEASTTKYTFNEEDFTDDQLQLLRIAFKLIDDVVEIQRQGNSDVYMCNELYYLKEKLGIYNLLEK